VRFLYEEMGFEVLVFESGIFDVRTAWQRIQGGANSSAAARASIDAVWSTSAELDPLFTYIGERANQSRPLVLAGMDPAFTGSRSGGTGVEFVAALEAYLNASSSPLPAHATWPAFRTVVDRLARREFDMASFTSAERTTFSAGIELLNAELNRLVNIAPPADASFWITMGLALNAQARSVALMQDNEPELAAAVRDSSMANSLVWLAQSAYPGRKIIVWSTATRIMRTPNELYNVRGQAEGHDRAIFGQLARVTLGDVMYSLGFLAGSGTYGPLDAPATLPIRPLVAPLPESWDGLFLATGKPFAFLHLRRTPSVENGWIFGRRVSRALGYQQLAANWTAIYDGFFFTASMEPATRVP
jgi:erythromycin esterase